jgi:Na+-transporting NADH:ubiquinone oxidoreductase subunit C
MNTSSNAYVLGFAVTVCVVISAMLAVTATSLRETQEAAKEFDRKKNVMSACGLIQDGDLRPRQELEQLYQQRVREQIVDLETGKVDATMTAAKVAELKDAKQRSRYRSTAVALDEQGKEATFVLPIQCKGLWGPMSGYLALDRDANTVRGITFYQHVETPGLGGEVDNPQWKAAWVGKTVLDDKGTLVGVTVKKGKVDPSIAAEKRHYVDGLSGATITSTGVTRGIKAELDNYKNYLGPVWAKKN